MSKKKRTFSNEFKAKLVLEALREEKPLNELASEHRVVPKNIINWKKHLVENIQNVFNKDGIAEEYKAKCVEQQKQIDELHRQLGEINTQLNWAKKKSKEFGIEY